MEGLSERPRWFCSSGSLGIVLLVAVQLVRVVGGHLGEILENVLVGFVS